MTTPLLPVDVGHLRHLATRPWPTRVLPMFTMEPAALTREYTFVSLYRAIAESLASEHAARVGAMEAAERAIDERREQLQLRFHHGGRQPSPRSCSTCRPVSRHSVTEADRPPCPDDRQ